MKNIGLALQLMVVGMATVFHQVTKQPQQSDIDSQTVAIIRSAVDQITSGKGQVKHIERL